MSDANLLRQTRFKRGKFADKLDIKELDATTKPHYTLCSYKPRCVIANVIAVDMNEEC